MLKQEEFTPEDAMKQFTKMRMSRFVLACSSAMYLCAGSTGVLAQTSDAAEASGTEESAIIVTGSRIQRRDYEANSPIVTANEALLKNNSSSSIETSLNRLPQFTAVQTPTSGSDIQNTATNTPGAATISLRGLGANRTLVLIDGKRATPSNASMVVDINTIPQAAIERVEIITGGASATYGADAVAGVVNFIMKKNFQGLQLDGKFGFTEGGGGAEYQISGIMGANFDDGRGNVTLAMSTSDRKQALRKDRQWFRDWWQNPNYGGNEFFPSASAFQPLPGNSPSQASVDAIFGAGVVANNSRLYFNTDGTAFTGFFQSPNGGVPRFKGDITGIKWKKTANGALAQNFVDELLILPKTSYNVYARSNYEINDWVGVFAQAMFNKTQTQTLQQPSPSVNGWSASIPGAIDSGEGYVFDRALPTELRNLLLARPDPTAPWQLTYYLDYANRVSRGDVYTYNVQAGFEGKVPGTDWTWEAYASQGESETSSLLTGAASLERFRAVVAAPNWGAGFSAQGNGAFGGFGANSASCTSGFDPFNKTALPSQDCQDAIKADLKTRSVMQQTVFEANAQGTLFQLPAGELKAAIGATHRSNRYEYLNDTLTTQGTSFLDQAIGIYPSGNSKGEIKSDEIYGELLVPILSDTFVKKLELELGARHSNYSTTGSSFTWKALADLQVNDWFRLRGGFNRAERSPNIGELYLAPQQTFVFNAAGDLCSRANAGQFRAFSANTAYNTHAAQAEALCRALMDRQGGTLASSAFYSDPNFYNTSGGTFAFPTLKGNATLKPEKANTWTLGAVISSPFDSAALRSLRLSIDYYNITVTDAIGQQSVDIAQRQCFDPAYNPTYSVASPYCSGINRVASDGALGNIITTYFNNGRFHTEGIDAQLDWAADVGPGRLSINTVLTYLLTLKSAELASDAALEYAGTLGPAQNGLNSGNFRWKMLNNFSYSIGGANIGLQWQHLPSIKSATYPGNNATTNLGGKAYDLFGLNASYTVLKDVTIRGGVDNLFNRAPPFVEVNGAPPTGTLSVAAGQSPINALLYDAIGRRFYIGATVKF